ncbi:hypothetical protein K490DRAFT_59058 [Saccharata proteae CBS 121410]|uniref:Uncharacterized protein n=1 Tax=Saccharata proteae CBS 121410 TaxID=1314787 RepID=A0A9P4HNQ5_9PEZI|nr:hypothetical protein K490DRAFT_59058 [Saccharata proteae CBS 121410]
MSYTPLYYRPKQGAYGYGASYRKIQLRLLAERVTRSSGAASVITIKAVFLGAYALASTYRGVKKAPLYAPTGGHAPTYRKAYPKKALGEEEVTVSYRGLGPGEKELLNTGIKPVLLGNSIPAKRLLSATLKSAAVFVSYGVVLSAIRRVNGSIGFNEVDEEVDEEVFENNSPYIIEGASLPYREGLRPSDTSIN